VAPIEFTLPLADYAAMGGHMDRVRPLASLRDEARLKAIPWDPAQPWPMDRTA
jgi:hypothetical protein